jgi:hypothetical protein
MTPAVRELIAAAVQAGRYEQPPAEALARDIAAGADVPLERLAFDSLGWMEFCISVEVNSGLELTPADIAGMRSLADVETWISARLPG